VRIDATTPKQPPSIAPALRTVDVHGLAVVLHKSVASVRNDLSRAPQRLPPPIIVGKKALWLETSVVEWLQGQTRQRQAEVLPPRRGRPTKVEQARRARAAAQHTHTAQEGGAV
jgi:hypothetical protein